MDTAKLRKLAVGQLTGLASVFLVGMFMNIFTDDEHKKLVDHLALVAHLLIGVFLLVVALRLWQGAVRLNDKAWQKFGSVGLAGIVIAFVAGAGFVSKDNDVLSFIMSVGCFIAFMGYALGLARSDAPKA